MNDNLPPYLIYGTLTAIAAFAGGLGLGVSQWMSAGFKSSTRKVFLLLLLGTLWPFRWGVTAIKEWRRVSVYRHRLITWDDLPGESKFAVHFQDLSDQAQALISWDHLPRQAKNNVRFQDLSEEARALIAVRDLPRGEKFTLLDKLILPQLQGAQHEGTLSLLDDKNSPKLSEAAQVTFVREPDYRDVRHDGMLLSLSVKFANPEAGFHLPVGERIAFHTPRLTVFGSVRNHTRITPNTQTVAVWAMFLMFEDLGVYAPSN